MSKRFMFFGAIVVWLTMVVPVTVLASWLLERPTGLWLLASLVLAPIAAFGLWRAIQGRSLKIRWPVMQLFGWGAVAMVPVAAGLLLTAWLPERQVALAVIAAWLLLGVTGVLAATRIREHRLEFFHERLDRPYRLVQLSDVHVGSRSPAFLERVVAQAVRHRPDALLITGDLIDASAVGAADLEALADLPCPAFLCLGNHERYVDLDAVIAMVEAKGVEILRTRSILHGGLQILGIDDADRKDHVERELPAIPMHEDRYRILLYHRPDGWHAARAAGVDLMLSGHTHGGQIWPFGHLVRRQFPFLTGLFSEGDRHLYVSPGTGCWGPVMRLGTRAEMTVIDLRPKDLAAAA